MLCLRILCTLIEFRSASYLRPIIRLSLFSDILSVTNIFRHTFVSNHASKPLRLGSYTLPTKFRSTTCLLPVYDLVYFPGNTTNFYRTLCWYGKWVVTHIFLVTCKFSSNISLCLWCFIEKIMEKRENAGYHNVFQKLPHLGALKLGMTGFDFYIFFN